MTACVLVLQVPELTVDAVDEVRGDETRSEWILGAIGLRLSPLPEVAAIIDPVVPRSAAEVVALAAS